jgi:hypothetical protein
MVRGSEDKSTIVRQWFSKSKFFAETESSLSHGADITFFPKIADNGAREFESLDQQTARPDLWPHIREAMSDAENSGCFIPRDKSASSDVIFITKKVPGEGYLYTVTIGLAVKCYRAPMSATQVDDEREKFNRMFVQPDSTSRTNERNILIVCNTGSYVNKLISDAELHTVIDNDDRYKCINETILLNLSTEDRRKEF